MNFQQKVELILDTMAFSVRLGCSDEERSFPQIVEFEVRADLGEGSNYHSDSISTTIDYLEISNALERLIAECEWKLLEKLCHDCAAKVLTLSEKIHSVRVRATKRRIAHIKGVSCEITLST